VCVLYAFVCGYVHVHYNVVALCFACICAHMVVLVGALCTVNLALLYLFYMYVCVCVCVRKCV